MLGKLKISCVLIVLLSIKVYSQATISADTLGYIYFNNLQPISYPYTNYYINSLSCDYTSGFGNIEFPNATSNNLSYYFGRDYVWQSRDAGYGKFYYNSEEDYGIIGLGNFTNVIVMPMRVAYISWVSVATNSALLKFSPGTDNPLVNTKSAALINITLSYDENFTNKVIYDNTYIARSDSVIWNSTHLVTGLQPNTKYYVRIARAYTTGYWCDNLLSISPYTYYSFTTLPLSVNKPILQTIMQTR